MPGPDESTGPHRAKRIGGLLATGVGCLSVLFLLAVTVAGRELLAAPVVIAALTTMLPYVFGATLAALFLLWSAAPNQRSLPVLCGILVIASAVLWGPGLVKSPTGDEPDLKLATWNVRRLWGGASDGGDPTACVTQAIRDMNVDVLALQEVSANDARKIGRDLQMTCSHVDYRGTQRLNRGGLATCVAKGQWHLLSTEKPSFLADNPWHYLFTEVQREEQVINIMNVHLRPYRIASTDFSDVADVPQVQSDQATELLDRVKRLADPTILAGDFNSSRDSALHVALRDTMHDTLEQTGNIFQPTYFLFNWVPTRIDFAYHSQDITTVDAGVLSIDCSDHRPVTAAVRLGADS